ncbi:MAG TPA: 2-oxoglutarate dehydrogenase complex dihydrolipoyllysine-residue succinyltransferase [Bacteroidia bacterium]|jgi:2-oxoglutarate dehydrogenase E2 component (dihydrolipoamide succinyltransferase)|nr:2-oxoglutarate dehydrogenase complex dihydrolipoyllysine-residue succinyltransferase [Bacteroidia bacterium]
MAIIDIKVPSPGESITEVTIARWLKNDGEYVNKDEEVLEIDSDKATLTVSAEQSGALKQAVKEGELVKVGSAVGKIDTTVKAPAGKAEVKVEAKSVKQEEKVVKSDVKIMQPVAETIATPLAKKIMEENKVSSKQVSGSGSNGKITKADVLKAMTKTFGGENGFSGTRDQEKQKMTPLRKKLAQRLVAVKNQTAMLTTFNEVDMSKILELRAKYNPQIEKQFGTKLGFMSFFTKAVCEALQLFPAVNAMIDGEEIVYHKYCDIGIAVSAPKGLVVPIIRNAEVLSLAGIEQKIKDLAVKARDNKLTIEEMTGGTFTITNGGVFGSLMSTPIINPPQVAILGMHNVVERPIAVNGKVEIRPMMYVALSYDHRIIDGRESVGFLVKVKEMCENPSRVLFAGKSPEEVLVGL